MESVLQSIDRAIEAIHFQSKCAGNTYSPQHKANLRRLQQHRQNVVEEYRLQRLSQQTQRTAPGPPAEQQQAPDNKAKRSSTNRRGPAPLPPQPAANVSPTKSAGLLSSPSQDVPSSPAPALPARTTSAPAKTISSLSAEPVPFSPRKLAEEVKIPEHLCSELVEQVRRNTQLSYDLSRVAVGTVLTQLKERIPAIGEVMDKVILSLVDIKPEEESVDTTQDAVELQELLEKLTACKDDSQQRSWFLHEDESVIMSHVEHVCSILTNANPEICKKVLSRDHYEAVHSLVLYYQMELRVSIKMLLLQTFGAMCALDARLISELLYSVLPLELARDMQSNTQDMQKLSFSALVLTMVLSMGERVPVHHYEQLNKSFIDYLIQKIESPPADIDPDQIQDLFVKLILAFNLHFELPEENIVMDVLAAQGTAKIFTEKLMLLFNRGDDPVRLFEHVPAPPNSLLKFMSDMYSRPDTSSILYTNDANVLIDIVLGQLSDLVPGQKIRTEYLSLFLLMLQNSNYEENQHRRDSLQVCFLSIAQEEGTESSMDRRVVSQIWEQFPHIFQPFV